MASKVNTKFRSILLRARELIVHGWTRNAFARLPSGRATGYTDESACRFCAEGAIRRASYELQIDGLKYGAAEKLGALITVPVTHYNDDSKSKKRVLELFDKAIARLK